jgi:hypothetical protein
MSPSKQKNIIILAALNHLSLAFKAGEDLSYLTSVMDIDLDSFDHHSINGVITEFEPKFSARVDEMFESKSITSNQEEELKKLNWLVMENNDYTDIEFDVTYLEETDQSRDMPRLFRAGKDSENSIAVYI